MDSNTATDHRGQRYTGTSTPVDDCLPSNTSTAGYATFAHATTTATPHARATQCTSTQQHSHLVERWRPLHPLHSTPLIHTTVAAQRLQSLSLLTSEPLCCRSGLLTRIITLGAAFSSIVSVPG